MPETILVTYIFSVIKEGKQKMKTFSKLLALILALSLVFSMSAAVFGAQSSSNTITVNGAKAGETYSAYKMLELFVDDVTNPTAYRYTVAPDWADFFANDNIAVWGTVLEKDATGTYFQGMSGVASETAWSATSDLSAFAEAAAAYAADFPHRKHGIYEPSILRGLSLKPTADNPDKSVSRRENVAGRLTVCAKTASL